MTDNNTERQVDRDLFNSLAADTLTVFKLVLSVLVLYGSIMALISREGTNEYVARTLGSLYTNFGIQFLLGSLLAVGLLYGWIRVKITYDEYPNNWKITDEEVATYALSSVVLGCVIAVFLLIAGLIDGAAPGGIPLNQFPALFLPIFLPVVIFDLLVLPQLLSRWGRTSWEYITAWRASSGTVKEDEIETPDAAEEHEGD